MPRHLEKLCFQGQGVVAARCTLCDKGPESDSARAVVAPCAHVSNANACMSRFYSKALNSGACTGESACILSTVEMSDTESDSECCSMS